MSSLFARVQSTRVFIMTSHQRSRVPNVAEVGRRANDVTNAHVRYLSVEVFISRSRQVAVPYHPILVRAVIDAANRSHGHSYEFTVEVQSKQRTIERHPNVVPAVVGAHLRGDAVLDVRLARA